MEIRLKIKIKDVEVELSEQEVRDLRNALLKLMPEPAISLPYPVVIEKQRWWEGPHWTSQPTIISGGTSGYRSEVNCLSLN